MVDISSQEKKINIKIQSGGVQANVGVTQDTAQYYSEKAREWAISNRIVDGVDYSSKYYAGKSNQSALNAQSFAQSVQNSANKALEDIETDKTDAISEINTTKTSAINSITTAENNAVNTINTTASSLANKDLNNLSTTGQAKFDAKVNKSGDTMTGELFMNGANIRMYQDGISQAINTRNTGFVLADGAPSKAQPGFRMNSTDANGVITHYYQTDNPTNGDTYTAISNTVYIDGATKYYPFIIGVTGAKVPFLKYNGKTMRYITDTYMSGGSWYRIYNDGWCEQGGRVTGETVTFLKNFKNTNYMIQKTLASPDQNTTQDRTVSFWNLTVSGATTFVASGYWFACGFIE